MNGSGDAFVGAVAWSLALGGDVLEAAAAGVAGSTIVATGLGGQDPLPDVTMLQALSKGVSIERVGRRGRVTVSGGVSATPGAGLRRLPDG